MFADRGTTMDADNRIRPPGPGAPRSAGVVGPLKAEPRDTVTVLVVDDEEAVRASTAAVLRCEGFDVLEAGDGAAATWALASNTVDVVLLDLQLRRLDGTAVLESLEDSSTVVVFSAFSFFEEPEIRKAFGPVVFECLRKPVDPRRLIEVVAAAAAHARAEGRKTRVRPIAAPKALRLALAGLARVTPEGEREDRVRVQSG